MEKVAAGRRRHDRSGLVSVGELNFPTIEKKTRAINNYVQLLTRPCWVVRRIFQLLAPGGSALMFGVFEEISNGLTPRQA